MAKGLLSILMCMVMVLSSFCNVIAEPAAAPVDLSGVRAAILMDSASGKLIIEKAAAEKGEVAGLVRLAPLLLVCSAFDEGIIDESAIVTVSSAASAIKGPTAFISPNEQIDAGSLLKAAVMLVAGDAIYALVQAAYGYDAAALEQMNVLLSNAGANISYQNVMGDSTLLSVKDIAAISAALSSSPSYLKYSSMYMDMLQHTGASPTELVNPNRLVRHYSGCFGMGTGSVGSAEYSGAFIVRRGTTTMLAVVAGAANSSTRFDVATEMLNYGFAAFRNVSLNEQGAAIGEVRVIGGMQSGVLAITATQATALLPVTDTKLTSEVYLMESINAPVEAGAVLGKLVLKNSLNESIGEVALIAAYEVERATLGDYFYMLLRSWLRIK